MKVVIDTDPGTDDALAIAMALSSPDLDVLGLTTVGGNASLADTTRNALALAEWLGHPKLPVSRGAFRPVRGTFSYAYHYHGAGGLTVRLPRPSGAVMPLRAPDYLAYMAYTHPGELVIIALGPLTNVAQAIRGEPRMLRWVKHIYVMGGALHVPGNVTPHAEFNIYSDPVAAGEVLGSGIDTTLIGLDVCGEPVLTPADVEGSDTASAGGLLAQEVVRGWFAFRPDSDRYMLCDPLTVAAAVRPQLFEYERAAVSVETDDGDRLGETTARYGEGSVQVARTVRAAEATAVVKAMLAG